MGGTLRRLLPQKIKYRFFFSSVIVILVPFFLLQLYYFSRTERLIVEKIKEQNGEQLSIMKTDYGSITGTAFLQWIELERSKKENGWQINMSGIGESGGVGGFSYGGLFTRTAVILILFILLVFISRGFLV